jgi:protein farnesyltransferase/geranylgeranyltransferase type-1 subunit alpha
MSDSDTEENEWIPFSKRPEWNDVSPVTQDEGPNPVCPIKYSPQFLETMNYFRAILQRDERSERAFDLTSEVIQLNAANYTVWYFRRLLLTALNINLTQELEFITKIGRKTPKNYQIWQHRKVIIEKTGEFANELEFTKDMIAADEGKNYHAWAHRQWVIETYGLWDKELDFIDDLLHGDLRNNSAWNQRYFVVAKWKKLANEVIREELQYAVKFINKAANNQSPWAYLKGLLLGKQYSDFPEVKETCLALKEKFVGCAHVLAQLVEIYEQENTPESKERARELCNILANNLDNIRAKYWNYRSSQIV